MKKIAITASINLKDNKINTAYIEAFTKKDLLPIVIPGIVEEVSDFITIKKDEEYKEKAKEIAKISDILILTGGTDINPISYGRKNFDSTSCNTKRDKSDLYLIDAFVALKKPIMGICRGMQLLGIYFGMKSLKQDLRDTDELHESTSNDLSSRQEFAHTIYLHGQLKEFMEENGIINKDKKKIPVNSFHHQGFLLEERKEGKKTKIEKEKDIKEIKETNNLNILATTDKIIEAFEHKDLPIFAVQWHPEEYGNKSLIIDYFLKTYVN